LVRCGGDNAHFDYPTLEKITLNLQSPWNVIPTIAYPCVHTATFPLEFDLYTFGRSILYRTIHGKCSAHSSAFPHHHNHHNALFTMLWHYVEERKNAPVPTSDAVDLLFG
jgi:hypothetical protein